MVASPINNVIKLTQGWLKPVKTSNGNMKRINDVTLKLLLVLFVLSLSGCATTSGRGDSPASDLDALVANAERDLRKTLLPNGKEYCAEDSVTDEQKDSCTGDLEDGLFNSNQDKALGLKNLKRGVKRIKLSLNPCGFWKKLFRDQNCIVD